MSELSERLRPPEVLNQGHSTAIFSCGEPELDRFLRESALNRQKAMLSRTYVVPVGSIIAGYYTLAHVQFTSAEMPFKLSRGRPSSIPAILMARLAVDTGFQGQGLGESLFADALLRTWAVVKGGAAPVRFFLVDAKHEKATGFYIRFGMKPLGDDSLRLYLSYKLIQAALEGAEQV
ncbi:MAG: GNAT family N-acetyltransferase [Armatimonadetes bacterium]|nr:GNAT family N-acetyltransferase [Armatimonadota bacterium]